MSNCNTNTATTTECQYESIIPLLKLLRKKGKLTTISAPITKIEKIELITKKGENANTLCDSCIDSTLLSVPIISNMILSVGNRLINKEDDEEVLTHPGTNTILRLYRILENRSKSKGGRAKPKKSRNKKHFSRKSKKSYKKLCKKCPLRKKLKRKSKKIRGGVAFNGPVDINNKSYNLPPLNTYDNTPREYLVDARLIPSQQGGKKKQTKKNRKMKGGNLIGTDIIDGSTISGSQPLAFNTTEGTEYMVKTLTAQEINDNSLKPSDTMVPMV